MSRKLFLILAFVLIFTLALLSACGTPSEEPVQESQPAPEDNTTVPEETAPEPEEVEAPQEKEEIEVWLLFDGETQWVWEQIVEEFNAANPNYNVVLTTHPNEEYKTAIQVALASNNPPDVFFNWPGDDTARFVREGNLLSLDEYAEQYDWHNGLGSAALSTYSVDDSVYGVPFSMHSKYFYYNKQIFEDLGLEEPQTFDEMLVLCETLNENDIVPMSFGNSERWQGIHYLSVLNQKMVGDATAGDYALTNSEDDLFTNPGYVKAFEKLLEMQNAGCFGSAPNATSPADAWAQFYSEAVAMTYGGTWTMGAFDNNGFEGQYWFFPMPAIEDGEGNQNYAFLGPDGLLVSSKTESPDGAVAFIDHFVSDANQTLFVEETKRPPVRNVDAEMSDVLSAAIQQMNSAEGGVLSMDVQLENSISEVYLNGIQDVLAEEKTPEQVVEEIREQAIVIKNELAPTEETAPAEAEAEAAVDEAEEAEIDVWLLYDGETQWVWEQIVEEFNVAYPTYNAVLTTHPNEEYKTAIQVALASNNPPDVFFNWPGDDTGRFVREDNILSLDDYADQYGWNDSLGAAALSTYSVDDSIYGVPFSLHSKFFYYNKQVFEELGLDEPQTFDELLDLCTTLTENDIVPMSFGNSERWQGVHYLSVLNQKMVDGDVMASDYLLTSPADELFTDPGYVQAFEKMLEMQNAGCFGAAPNATSPADAWAQFYSEAVAMTYGGTWTMGAFDNNGFEDQYWFFPMPAITEGAGNQNYVFLGPDGLLVSSKTESPDASATFIDFFVSEANQKLFVEATKRPPVREVDAEMSDVLVAAVAAIKEADGGVLSMDVELENSISEVYLNGIQDVLAEEKTPEQVVEEIRQQALVIKEELGR